MLTITIERGEVHLMIIARFNRNIAKNLEQILSYCVHNGIDSYVDFDKDNQYTVKIDVSPMVEQKAKDLIKHLNNIKKMN